MSFFLFAEIIEDFLAPL